MQAKILILKGLSGVICGVCFLFVCLFLKHVEAGLQKKAFQDSSFMLS